MDFSPLVDDSIFRQSPEHRRDQEDARVQLGGMLQDLDREVESAKNALIDKMSELLAAEAAQVEPSSKIEELKEQKSQLSERLKVLEERFARASAEANSL